MGEKIDNLDFNLDALDQGGVAVELSATPSKTKVRGRTKAAPIDMEVDNCLLNEKIIVRKILKPKGEITNTGHVLYGGMADNAVQYITLPMKSTGGYKNALTKSEKAFLEEAMGLEDNALSVHLKNDNYWESEHAIVRLTKSDTILDLSDPTDYIKYKILTANSGIIADSLGTMQSRPKETYQYVIIRTGEETKSLNEEMTLSMQASLELGKVMENKDILKYLIETLEGKAVSDNSSLQ